MNIALVAASGRTMRALGVEARTTLPHCDCIVEPAVGDATPAATGVLFDFVSSPDSLCNCVVLRRYVCPGGCITFHLMQFQFSGKSLRGRHLQARCQISHATITHDSKTELAFMLLIERLEVFLA